MQQKKKKKQFRDIKRKTRAMQWTKDLLVPSPSILCILLVTNEEGWKKKSKRDMHVIQRPRNTAGLLAPSTLKKTEKKKNED